jgi:hypothetical protein
VTGEGSALELHGLVGSATIVPAKAAGLVAA